MRIQVSIKYPDVAKNSKNKREMKRKEDLRKSLEFCTGNFDSQSSAYETALRKNLELYFKSSKDLHSAMEGMLIELGNFLSIKHTCIITKSFDNKKLKDLIEYSPMPEFTYKEITDIISKSDVIWFSKNKLLSQIYFLKLRALLILPILCIKCIS